jgi:glyoxylase-like metal-dependent hydrolase (beta-lactamase superfamily II)
MFVTMKATTVMFATAVTLAVAADAFNVTQVLDPKSPWENPEQYIVSDGGQAFIVDTGKFAYQGQHLVNEWDAVVGAATPPLYLFITHGHPDHTGNIALILSKWPSVPVYVANAGVIREAEAWQHLVCTQYSGVWSKAQCALRFNTTMQLAPASLPSLPDASIAMTVIQGFQSAETTYAGMLMVKAGGKHHLFSGDVLSIRSHLYVSDFFFGDSKYPFSDQLVCDWAGDVQSFGCALPTDVIVYPGHGPTTADYQAQTGKTYMDALHEIVDWLRIFREQSFNTCNATLAWDHMLEAFPTFGMASYFDIGVMADHVPGDAVALGCECNGGLPAVCNLSPPKCGFLDGTTVPPACIGKL